MRSMRAIRHMPIYTFYCCALMLALLLLAGCGADSPAGSPASAVVPAATPAPTVNGYGTAHGCPDNVVVESAPAKANVTLQVANINTPATAHVGDVIEIRLPFGQHWNAPKATPAGLELQQPAGYAWKSDNVCVWRFVAKNSGTTTLNFTSQALCGPGKMCPMFITNDPFMINVTA